MNDPIATGEGQVANTIAMLRCDWCGMETEPPLPYAWIEYPAFDEFSAVHLCPDHSNIFLVRP